MNVIKFLTKGKLRKKINLCGVTRQMWIAHCAAKENGVWFLMIPPITLPPLSADILQKALSDILKIQVTCINLKRIKYSVGEYYLIQIDHISWLKVILMCWLLKIWVTLQSANLRLNRAMRHCLNCLKVKM